MKKKLSAFISTVICTPLLAAGALWAVLGSQAYGFGEAGPLRLAQFGNFMVNIQQTGDGAITDQMYVEFMIPEEQRYPYPIVLVHGGGGAGTDWMATVDGRDGWVNYLVNAGFAVYWIDRPGSNRSVSNNTYGDGELGDPNTAAAPLRLAVSENWPGAPMVYNSDGSADIDGWRAQNQTTPSILAWAATAPTTPFASNEVSIAAQVALLEKIGPAVVFTHSAGGTTSTAASLEAAAGDLVVGMLAFESGGADPYGNNMLNNARWSSGAPDENSRSEQHIDTGACSLQSDEGKSSNLTFADVRMAYLNSERLDAADFRHQVACQAAQSREAGVETIGVYMPDHEGGDGTGHFAMSETVNGEIAVNILVPVLGWLQGEALPTDFKTY